MGPVDGGVILLHLKGFPVLALRPGGIVIMDNLGAHRINGAREAIEAAGATLRFLPRDPPGCNPIGNILAKLRALPRKAAVRAKKELDEAVNGVLKAIAAADCANCFAAAGCVNRN